MNFSLCGNSSRVQSVVTSVFAAGVCSEDADEGYEPHRPARREDDVIAAHEEDLGCDAVAPLQGPHAHDGDGLREGQEAPRWSARSLPEPPELALGDVVRDGHAQRRAQIDKNGKVIKDYVPVTRREDVLRRDALLDKYAALTVEKPTRSMPSAESRSTTRPGCWPRQGVTRTMAAFAGSRVGGCMGLRSSTAATSSEKMRLYQKRPEDGQLYGSRRTISGRLEQGREEA